MPWYTRSIDPGWEEHAFFNSKELLAKGLHVVVCHECDNADIAPHHTPATIVCNACDALQPLEKVRLKSTIPPRWRWLG